MDIFKLIDSDIEMWSHKSCTGYVFVCDREKEKKDQEQK